MAGTHSLTTSCFHVAWYAKYSIHFFPKKSLPIKTITLRYFAMDRDFDDAKLDIIRMENERYLRKHPELQDMISKFMISLLKDKPTDVLQYAIVFFTTAGVEPV